VGRLAWGWDNSENQRLKDAYDRMFHHSCPRVVPFVPNEHLALTDPALAVDVRQEGEQLVIDVGAQSLARFVELALDGVSVVFSNNHFDLPAGRTVTVTCPMPEMWTVEEADGAVQMRSLYDSFAQIALRGTCRRPGTGAAHRSRS
jgi:hypothetical protein